MMQPQKPQPYKVDDEKPVHEYSVLDNGDIKVHQTLVSTSYWKNREFIGLIRQDEKALEEVNHQLSEKYKETLLDQKSQIEAELLKFEPLKKLSDERTKVEHEKMIQEGLTRALKQNLEAQETNLAWFQQVWLRAKEELRKVSLGELTDEEMKKFSKIVANMKRKNIK